MTEAGTRNRRKPAVAFRAAGGRVVPAVRAVQAELIGLARDPVATVCLVIADSMPLIIMFDGEPFLHEGKRNGMAVYAKARPYRITSDMVLR